MNKAILTLSLAALAAAANAAIIAYEGMAYDAGLAINTNTLNGGTGWTNAWTANSGTTGTAWTTNATGLTYTDGTKTLTVSGGSMFDGGSSGDSNRWRRNFAIPGGSWGTTGGTTYFSFLTDRTDTNTGTVEAWTFRLQQDGTTLAQFKNIAGTTDGWEILDGQTTPVSQVTTTSISEISAVFVVGRVTHVSGNDLLEIWLNPNLTTLGTATLSATFVNFNALNGFSFQTGSTPTGRFDEIRFGTTFADVTPVPEPATLALAGGLLAFALVMWRRRRA